MQKTRYTLHIVNPGCELEFAHCEMNGHVRSIVSSAEETASRFTDFFAFFLKIRSWSCLSSSWVQMRSEVWKVSEVVRVTCRDPRSSSSEKISITSSFPVTSFSRLTPLPSRFLPSALTEGPGGLSGGEGEGDWGIIPCALSISAMGNSIQNQCNHQIEQRTSFPIQEAEGQPRGAVSIIHVDLPAPVFMDSFSEPTRLR